MVIGLYSFKTIRKPRPPSKMTVFIKKKKTILRITITFTILAHLDKGRVAFCHHLVSVVRLHFKLLSSAKRLN